MADYYCRICNVRKVANPGDICANCQDPYQQVPPVADNAQPFISQQDSGNEPVNQNYSENDDSAAAVLHSGRSRRQIMGASPVSRPASNSEPVDTSAPRPIENAPVIPSAQTKNDIFSAAVQNQKSSIQGPQTEGVVRNITEGKDPSGFLGRWFRSFVTGTSFPMSDEQTEFQVFANWQNGNNAQGYAADKVIVYGHMQNNKPVQDNTVRVYGKRNKNNAIIADVIENTTDGTRTEFQPAPLPAMLVKVLTLIILAVIVLLGVLLFCGISEINGGGLENVGAGIGNFARNLVLAIIAGLATYYFGARGIKLLIQGGNGSSVFMYAVGVLIAGSAFISFITSLF